MSHELSSRIAALAVAALVLGGCSDEGNGEATPTSSTSSSEASEPTSSATVEVPELPEAATGTDDAAAVAFVEHWVELLNYGLVTGDTEPARALATDCSNCDEAFALIEDTASPDTVTWTLGDPGAVPVEASDPAGTASVVQADLETANESGLLTIGLSRAGSTWGVSWVQTS